MCSVKSVFWVSAFVIHTVIFSHLPALVLLATGGNSTRVLACSRARAHTNIHKGRINLDLVGGRLRHLMRSLPLDIT